MDRLALEDTEDPVSTMSAEVPGKSSTREGLTLNTGVSLPEDTTDARLGAPFFLGPVIGGRTEYLELPVWE